MRHAKIVHSLGWRATFEAFSRLAHDLDEDVVARTVEQFAALDPELLKAFRVDDLPLSPIRAIPR
jgi:hypothetical protein